MFFDLCQSSPSNGVFHTDVVLKGYPMIRCFAFLPLIAFSYVVAQEPTTAPTRLTIYNQDFAVARTTVPLDLHAGMNEVLTTNVTGQLEPDSVVLRDASGRNLVHVAEQNYDSAVVDQQWMMEKYEGKTIDFQIQGPQVVESAMGERQMVPARTVEGRIIRAGGQAANGYPYNQPLIEVGGKMQFSMPGTPVFPATTDGLLLKPTLRWQIDAEKAARFSAELDYITHGMNWQATYNVVVPETADTTGPELAEIVGWVTIENKTGTDFPEATIQLMAGDVAKIQDLPSPVVRRAMGMNQNVEVMAGAGQVTQKAFDDFHLYDLHRTVSLRNEETKQVQFLDASKVTVRRTYQFEGGPATQAFYPGYHNDQVGFSNSGNTRVSIIEEIKNSESNHLGMPLPAGRLRLYRRDTSGQMQFVGENMIVHTPAEQTVKMISGSAFDLTAARRQTDFKVDNMKRVMDESFEIKLSNQKAQPVTIHSVEHMGRGENWEIAAKSSEFTKRDSSTIDFPVTVPAKGEAILSYTVHYSW
jgi:hypothetical protein